MKGIYQVVWEWGVRCFGRDHMIDRRVRAIRLLEEAVEYVQTCDVEEEIALKCVQTVYSRPVGSPEQELGGVLVTAAVCCMGQGLDPDEVLLKEVLRVLNKGRSEMAQRNEEKLELGLK